MILAMFLLALHALVNAHSLVRNQWEEPWLRGLILTIFGLELVSIIWLGSYIFGGA